MPKRSFRTIAAAMLCACAVLPAAVPAWAEDAPALPGGASSLQETHQDWRIACRIVDKTKRCSISQQQIGKNRQRVLAVELQASGDGTVTGVLMLLFGLLLDKGVTLQVDDKPALAPTAGAVASVALLLRDWLTSSRTPKILEIGTTLLERYASASVLGKQLPMVAQVGTNHHRRRFDPLHPEVSYSRANSMSVRFESIDRIAPAFPLSSRTPLIL